MNQVVQNNTPPASAAEQSLQAQTKRAGVFNNMLKIAAFPIAAIVGTVVTRIDTRGRARQEALKEGLFSDFIDGIETAKKTNNHELLNQGKSLTDYLEEQARIKTRYRSTADTYMEKAGRGGFFGQLDSLTRSSKQKVFLEGITAGTIALGVILTIADSRVLLNLFGYDKEDKPR